MNLIKKSTLNLFPSVFLKLKTVLDIIDKIEVSKDKAIITLSKDVVIVNEGSLITINKGINVTIANEIHLNPDIKLDNKLLQLE
jgi:presenilin-like A22 family membrane protease